MNDPQLPFEVKWREKLSGYAPPATDSDWADMQSLLAVPRRKRARRYLRWWLWLVPVLGVSAFLVVRAGWIATATQEDPVPPTVMSEVMVPPDPEVPKVPPELENRAADTVIESATPQPAVRTETLEDSTRRTAEAPSDSTADPFPARRTARVCAPLPVATLRPPRSRGPSLAERLEAAGKTLIVVPGDGPAPRRKVDNGLYPPFRNH